MHEIRQDRGESRWEAEMTLNLPSVTFSDPGPACVKQDATEEEIRQRAIGKEGWRTQMNVEKTEDLKR